MVRDFWDTLYMNAYFNQFDKYMTISTYGTSEVKTKALKFLRGQDKASRPNLIGVTTYKIGNTVT